MKFQTPLVASCHNSTPCRKSHRKASGGILGSRWSFLRAHWAIISFTTLGAVSAIAAGPTVPTNLKTAPAGCSQINVSWGASTVTGGTLKGYNVYRDANTPIFVAAPSTSFNDTALPGGATHTYQVSALDTKSNESAKSTAVTTNTPLCADTTAPTVPGNLTASAVDCGTVSLSWSTSSDPAAAGQTASGVKAYNIYRGGVLLKNVTTTTATDSSLAASTAYAYQVTAVDNAANESVLSAAVSATTPACAVPPPTLLTASNVLLAFSGQTATVQWSGTTGVRYQVESAPSPQGPWTPVDVPTTTSGVASLAVQPAAFYRVAVFTNTAAYLANYSANINDTTPPTAPTGLTLGVPSSSSVTMTWSPSVDIGSSGLDHYLVYRNGIFLKSVAPTAASDNSVSPGGQYTYSVAAVDRAGNVSATVANNVTIAANCVSVVPASIEVDADPTNATFTVDTTGCSWNASVSPTNNSWVSMPTTAGSTDASLTYSITANPDTTDRTGTIIVQNTAYRITQHGRRISSVTISTSVSPIGTGNASPASTSVTSGSTVQCVAAANAGYSFANWTENGTVVSSSASYSFSANANRSLVANFAAIPCTYSIDTSSSTGGSASGGGTVNCGASVTVTASPSAGYNFANWTENGSVVSSSASYTFTANSNRSLVANFTVVSCTYVISTSSSPVAGGSTAGGGTVNCGSTVTVTASASAGYNFANWTENGSVVSSSASYTFAAGANRNLVANFAAVNGPNPGAFSWALDFRGTVFQDSIVSKAVAVDKSDNSVLVAGEYLGSSCSVGGTALPSALRGVFLAKFSSSGAPIWVKSFQGTSAQLTTGGLSVDSSGNIVLAGTFTATVDFGASTGPLTSSGWTLQNNNCDIFVAKFSSTGACQWAKNFGGSQMNDFGTVTVDPSGNVILGGYVRGVVDFGGGPLASIGFLDIFVAKFSAAGVHQWSKRFGGASSVDWVTSMATDPSGNVYIGGNFNNTLDFGSGTGALNSAGGQDMFLAKLSSAGLPLWARRCGGAAGNDMLNSIAVDNNGNVALTGAGYGTIDFSGSPLSLAATVSQAFFAKYGADGTFAWAKAFNEMPLGEAGNGVAFDGAGNVLFTGYTWSDIYDFPGGRSPSFQTANIYILKASPTGDWLWGKRYSNVYSSSDHGYDIAVDSNNNVITAGDMGGQGGQLDFGGGIITASLGSADGFLLKLGP